MCGRAPPRADACSAETSLRLVIPGREFFGAFALEQRRGKKKLRRAAHHFWKSAKSIES
jgi:hypothetical protein